MTLKAIVDEFPFSAMDDEMRVGLRELIKTAKEEAEKPSPTPTLIPSENLQNQAVSIKLRRFRLEEIAQILTAFHHFAKPEPLSPGATAANPPNLKPLAAEFGKTIYGTLPGGGTPLDSRIEFFVRQFMELQFVLFRFAVDLLQQLYESRVAFKVRIVGIREAEGLPFEDPPKDLAVRQRLDQVLVTDGGNAFGERVETIKVALERARQTPPPDPDHASTALKNAICPSPPTPASKYRVDGFVAKVNEELKPASNGTLANLLAVSRLTDDGQRALQAILRDWKEFVDSLTARLPDAQQPFQGPPANVTGIVSAILASNAGPTQNQIRDLAQLFTANSDLIPQVAAA